MDPFGQFAIQLVLLAVMLFGLFSLVLLPILPGLVIIWLAALVYGLSGHFLGTLPIVIFVVITLLMLFGSVIDNILMGAGARKTGASWVSITVALVAGLVGSLLWPPLGGILLSLAALFVVELLRLRDVRSALVSTRSMALGCGWAIVARFFIGLAMIGLYVAWTFNA